MSDTETNILLPAAGVDFFLKDKKTAEAARALSDDWRFARVSISVEDGDVETAIAAYKTTRSPALVIIETDTTDDAFTARLEALAEHCAEGTNAVIIGPVNDVNLYRRLTAMGVRDYLVRPVAQDILGDVIASALIGQLGAAGSRLIAMIGAKGGAGVSTLSQILAWGLSENLAQKTFLLDAAGGWSSLSVGMGFEPQGTIAEAMRAAAGRDEDTLRRMLFKPNERLSVLASGSEALLDTHIHPQQYEELLDMVMTSYPLVIADLSASAPPLKRTVLNRAHETILVAQPTLASLRAVRSLIQEIKMLRGGHADNVDLVINMQGMAPGKEITKADIAAALGTVPSAFLPYDARLFVGLESDGRKITQDKNAGGFIDALLPLAQKVMTGKEVTASLGDRKESGGMIGNILGKLKK